MKRTTRRLVAALFSFLLAMFVFIFLSQNWATRWAYSRPAANIMYTNKNYNYTSTSPSDKVKHYDVILSGYMRSGSSFTGELLGHRDDTFYFYEPLWKLLRMSYWNGNHSICKADSFECRASDGSLENAKHVLRSIYNCRFNYMNKETVLPAIAVPKGGPRWNPIRSCNSDKIVCMKNLLPNVCNNSTHKVTKVLRLTTDILGEVLHERANLKVIHLFRDPRAVINSRIHTDWYQLPASKIIGNAKSLCHKMLYDFRKGKTLYRLYPNRFRFVYYEDITKDIENKAKILLRYVGMNINTIDDFSKYQSDNTLKWRNILKWDVVRRMQPDCAGVYKELGYKSFPSKEAYMNMTFQTVDIPKEYLVS